ncbi:hypothetical protein EOE67_13365 [Rheinheimera riviphila]|uniref:Uncharacterized protein n=1 Tax=Rheinheimera riviphila TaxID=1834037 RepID=A0A437QM28_9GAMM|nr:DUF6151 family protein [Rheinheimera riviphila]RVU35578.1 hypothetical protein EOE67_13365 [Rheinheimera riviphila]
MHPLQCQCGLVRAEVDCRGTHNRLICYCTDCQAFGRFVTGLCEPAANSGSDHPILDAQGGTELIQVAQSKLRFLQGEDQLLAVRLSEQGMIRWYTRCCQTPIGNTMASRGGAFIGVIHSCLNRLQLNADFGEQVAQLNTNTALGTPKPPQHGLFRVISSFLWLLISERVSGRYLQSPLFNPDGSPRSVPLVLSAAELAALKTLG